MIRAGSLGKFGKEARKIRVRLDAIGAGRFDQRIQFIAEEDKRPIARSKFERPSGYWTCFGHSPKKLSYLRRR